MRATRGSLAATMRHVPLRFERVPDRAALRATLASAKASVYEKRRAALLRGGIQPSFPRTSRVSVQTPLIVVALLVLNAIGLPGGPSAGGYLLALLLLLSLSALPLVFLVVELGASPK